MSGVLDPEELEALMAEDEDSKSASSGKYNLARQDYAVQRLIPTLSMIQSQFANFARDRMREFVASVESVSTDRISVMKFDELLGTLPAPCSISVVSGMPLGSNLLIAFESELVFTFVDRYFGGYGSKADAAREQFSTSEFSFMELLNAALLPDIANAWKAVMQSAPTITSQSSDPRLLEGFNQADSLVATRFEVSVGDVKGGLWSVVPWSALDALRESIAVPGKAGDKPASADWRARLSTAVEEAPLELVAEIAHTRLSLNRVAQLKKGDVIPIASPDEVAVKVGGKTMLRGMFGSNGGQYAVRLTGPSGKI